MKYKISIKGPFLLAIFTLIFNYSCIDNNEEFVSEASDNDGDGVLNSLDQFPDDPCLPIQESTYTSFNVFSLIWQNADCDGDGILNAEEFEDPSRNPYVNEEADTDGDGVPDFLDPAPQNPCVPEQSEGYIGFDSNNGVWGSSDCDNDGVSNIDEFINGTDPYKGCNLDFDFSNFEGELQVRDSNNGDNIVVASLLTSCNEISISGDFLNLGCINSNIEFLLFLDPFVEGGNEGNAIVENATFNCTNEAGETVEYTFNANGFFSGSDGFMEFFGYTLTGGGETITGNLFIEQISDGGGNEKDRCSFEGEYNSIVNIDGNEIFGSAILTQNPENCNEYILGGDFLNQGCNNNLELGVFLGEEEGGSEVIISETTFSCETDSGTTEYTFRGFGSYSTSEGFIELSEFTLITSNGSETSGTIFFEAL
ncbi:hypothetical protein [Algibacter pectinivorans]|uniref:EF-hand domain-containing protein n=1 Tax=Algibacter pectinivorans TaxID=870482 RepID=A0A1I1RK65_9FLAO|nr:hypothetical protein [Algibacter pectinivorans]SFD34716.1 hypothetical protein SAMN04487987_11062 [Algibacter pectinivorans]